MGTQGRKSKLYSGLADSRYLRPSRQVERREAWVLGFACGGQEATGWPGSGTATTKGPAEVPPCSRGSDPLLRRLPAQGEALRPGEAAETPAVPPCMQSPPGSRAGQQRRGQPREPGAADLRPAGCTPSGGGERRPRWPPSRALGGASPAPSRGRPRPPAPPGTVSRGDGLDLHAHRGPPGPACGVPAAPDPGSAPARPRGARSLAAASAEPEEVRLERDLRGAAPARGAGWSRAERWGRGAGRGGRGGAGPESHAHRPAGNPQGGRECARPGRVRPSAPRTSSPRPGLPSAGGLAVRLTPRCMCSAPCSSSSAEARSRPPWPVRARGARTSVTAASPAPRALLRRT